MANAQKAYRDAHLAAYLRWKYPSSQLLVVDNHTYPVAVFRPTPEQMTRPDDVLQTPLLRSDARDIGFIVKSKSYRRSAHKLGLNLYDRPCFTMKRLMTEGSLQVQCELGSYFGALDSCDSLAWELLSSIGALSSSTSSSLTAFDRRLRLRSRLHAEVVDPVKMGRGRNAAIGISVLIAYNDGADTQLLVRRRGPTVAIHNGMVHVAPSCMFQPATMDHDREFSVVHNIFREYLEELFDRPEADGREADFRYFYNDPRLLRLRRLLEEGNASLVLTGVAVNLLNLRPEICLLLHIPDPSWYGQQATEVDGGTRFRFNEEWMPLSGMGGTPRTAIHRITYRAEAEEMLASAGFDHAELIPAGAAALWLGKSVLDSWVRGKITAS